MPGVTDDRPPSLGSTEKENAVSSPVVSQAAVPKDSTNDRETNEPSAAAKLGLVHSADDGSEAVVGWESFTGKEPTIPTEEASFLNTLPQKPPTLPTWGFLVVNTVDFVLGHLIKTSTNFSLCSLAACWKFVTIAVCTQPEPCSQRKHYGVCFSSLWFLISDALLWPMLLGIFASQNEVPPHSAMLRLEILTFQSRLNLRRWKGPIKR